MKLTRPRNRIRGLSLIELLVALALFAMMSALAFTGLNVIVKNNEGLGKNASELRAMQFAVGLLERDLIQISNRNIRSQYGEERFSMIGAAQEMEWTRRGLSNPFESARSNLERVRYFKSERKFLRETYAALDRVTSTTINQRNLLEEIDGLDFRYLDQAGVWQTQWPVRGLDDGQNKLPVAIEFSLSTKSFGNVRRLIELIDYLPRDAAPNEAETRAAMAQPQ